MLLSSWKGIVGYEFDGQFADGADGTRPSTGFA